VLDGVVGDFLCAIVGFAFFPNKLLTCEFVGAEQVILTLKITLTLSDGGQRSEDGLALL
jgi:hypothetical protein